MKYYLKTFLGLGLILVFLICGGPVCPGTGGDDNSNPVVSTGTITGGITGGTTGGTTGDTTEDTTINIAGGTTLLPEINGNWLGTYKGAFPINYHTPAVTNGTISFNFTQNDTVLTGTGWYQRSSDSTHTLFTFTSGTVTGKDVLIKVTQAIPGSICIDSTNSVFRGVRETNSIHGSLTTQMTCNKTTGAINDTGGVFAVTKQ